jgi:hypothetical protein
MRRHVKIALTGVVVIAFLLFFFCAPVIGLSVPGGCGDIQLITRPSYESLSFHFFNTGEVYFARHFDWMTSAFAVPSCAIS